MSLAPLRLVAIGVGLTLVDLSLGGFGLSFAFIGWLVALGGLLRLSGMHRGFDVARISLLVLIGVSLLGMFLPLRAFVPFLGTLLGLVQVALLAGICLGVAGLSARRDRRIWLAAWLLAALVAAPAVLRLVVVAVSSLAPLLLPLTGLSWLATIALAIFLWVVGDRHYLGANAA
jgi:hypothetical protein